MIKVSLSQSGLRGLCRIASHPVVAPRVKTLIFYSGNIIIESGEREPSKDRLTAPQQLPQNLAFENDYYFTHKVFIPFAYQYAEHQGYKFAKAKEDVHQLKLVLEKLQNLERIQVGGGDLSTLPISGLSFATSTNVLMKDITYFLRVLVEALRAIYFL